MVRIPAAAKLIIIAKGTKWSFEQALTFDQSCDLVNASTAAALTATEEKCLL